MHSDAELMTRIQERDEDAFAALYARYSSTVQRHLANTLRDATAAEDLLQEVFLRVWTRAEQWQGRGELAGWLYRIATNLALNYLRSQRRRPQQPLERQDPLTMAEDDVVPGWLIDRGALRPDAVTEQGEALEQLQQMIAALPEDQRAVLLLAQEDGMGMRDIADVLEIAEGTVKSRLHHVRRALARAWKED